MIDSLTTKRRYVNIHEHLNTNGVGLVFFSVALVRDSRLRFSCSLAYVDLNLIRAGIAETPETSRFTSVFERIELAEAGVRLPAQVPPSGRHSGLVAEGSAEARLPENARDLTGQPAN